MENQVAVVTGGARGIGAGIVRRFVDEFDNSKHSDLLASRRNIRPGAIFGR
jgi:NAD(P)-dependent dehydrogenase (short-subunit alcohol dehydrogenase family)